MMLEILDASGVPSISGTQGRSFFNTPYTQRKITKGIKWCSQHYVLNCGHGQTVGRSPNNVKSLKAMVK